MISSKPQMKTNNGRECAIVEGVFEDELFEIFPLIVLRVLLLVDGHGLFDDLGPLLGWKGRSGRILLSA